MHATTEGRADQAELWGDRGLEVDAYEVFALLQAGEIERAVAVAAQVAKVGGSDSARLAALGARLALEPA